MNVEKLREQISEQTRSEIKSQVGNEQLTESGLRGFMSGMSVAAGLTSLAVGGAIIVGAPLLSLATVLGAGLALSGLGMLSRNSQDQEFAKAIEKVEATIYKRDELIADALKRGYTMETLDQSPNFRQIKRVTDDQKKEAKALRRIIRRGNPAYESLSLREQGALEGVLRAAEAGRLTAIRAR